jgi:RNA polymerase sigma factor (sigma-70 family)
LEDDIQVLIDGCRRNNRKAQELLYKKFYRALAAICARYTKDQQDTLEVLNDAYLKIFRNIAQYDAGKGSFYTWACSIVIHAAIDFLRRLQPPFEAIDFVDVTQPVIESDAIQKMGADELLQLIRQLPTATHLVFNLYVIEGFTHREIAGMLGISEGTSKWHVSEGRKQIQRSIHLERARQ